MVIRGSGQGTHGNKIMIELGDKLLVAFFYVCMSVKGKLRWVSALVWKTRLNKSRENSSVFVFSYGNDK